MCMPQHEVQYTRSVGKEEADAMGLNGPDAVYGDEGGLEGDEARARQAAYDNLFIKTPLDPLGALGTFAVQKLPRIGVGDLKRTATAAPYDGLRIKTPGKV